jgi:hypothetical protein
LVLCCLQQLFVNFSCFFRIHDLHVKLGNLFLNGQLTLSCVELCDFILKFLCLDVFMVDASVP